MRPIHKNRKILELKSHERFFTLKSKKHFHMSNFPLMGTSIRALLKITRLEQRGYENSQNVTQKKIEIAFDELPPAFDGTKILLITDLHIDGIGSLTDTLVTIASESEYDFSILGGDYHFHHRGNANVVCRKMERIGQELLKKSRVFGILGNHDDYEIAVFLEKLGIEMLMNENICLDKNGDRMYIAGLDDCNYFSASEIELAGETIPDNAFKILLCHSPELYKEAHANGYSLYLAGHTHGGQICLPGGRALMTGANVPRALVKGKWAYKSLKGYTSFGAGCSCVPARFGCPPEVVLLTLTRK